MLDREKIDNIRSEVLKSATTLTKDIREFEEACPNPDDDSVRYILYLLSSFREISERTELELKDNKLVGINLLSSMIVLSNIRSTLAQVVDAHVEISERGTTNSNETTH